jgi:hypothetical protein
MKTLATSDKPKVKEFQDVTIIHQKVIQIVLERAGKFLLVQRLSDEAWKLPGFRIKYGELLESQINRFASKYLGINILKFNQIIGPIFFDPGIDEVDYLDIQIAVPKFWQQCQRTNETLELSWFMEEDVFSKVNHLSRLCISEYWNS